MSAEQPAQADPERVLDLLIVGAGIAGLGLGLRLAGSGRDFLILERAAGVGGTWYQNRYPGVGCDIPAELYSYSFRTAWPWQNRFASGAEIRAYLRHCAQHPGLAERILLRNEMLAATWDDSRAHWRVQASAGVFFARTLCIAAGRLSEPRLPPFAGSPEFSGEQWHSSEIPEGWIATGKRVGIVGSGASAIQMIPDIAQQAARTVLFQRTPTWVLPKHNRTLSPLLRAARLSPAVRRWRRERLFRHAERGYRARARPGKERDRLTALAQQHRELGISDPVLRERLTPAYELGCKRAVFSDSFFPALNAGRVELSDEVIGIGDGAVLTSSGARVQGLDTLIFATGFLAAEAPFSQRIRGRTGQTLAEHWSEGMTALDTVAISGFPNMFVLDGPNATLGHNSAIDMIETQVSYVLGALRTIGASGVLEATPAAELASSRDIDARARGTVWAAGGCDSWYRDPRSGRLTLIWPGTARSFHRAHSRFSGAGFSLSRRALPRARGVLA